MPSLVKGALALLSSSWLLYDETKNEVQYKTIPVTHNLSEFEVVLLVSLSLIQYYCRTGKKPKGSFRPVTTHIYFLNVYVYAQEDGRCKYRMYCTGTLAILGLGSVLITRSNTNNPKICFLLQYCAIVRYGILEYIGKKIRCEEQAQ